MKLRTILVLSDDYQKFDHNTTTRHQRKYDTLATFVLLLTFVKQRCLIPKLKMILVIHTVFNIHTRVQFEVTCTVLKF